MTAALAAWDVNPAKFVDDLVDMNARGVLGDGALSATVHELVKRLEDKRSFSEMSSAELVKYKFDELINQFAGGFRFTDEFLKVSVYKSELEDMRAAYPKASEEEIRTKAAERTRLGTVTFSKQGKAIKTISQRFPVFPFATYLVDSIRAHIANIVIATKDISEGVSTGNSALRNAGIRRAMGTAIVGGGLSATLHAMKDGEKDKDTRNLMPEYDRHKDYVGGDVQEDGRIKYTPTERYNPFPITGGIISNAIRGDTEGMMKALYEPILSTGIGVKEVFTVGNLYAQSRGRELTDREEDQMKEALTKLGEMSVPSGKTSVDMFKAVTGNTREHEEGTFSGKDFIMKMLGVTTSYITPVEGSRSALAKATSEYTNSYSEVRGDLKTGLSDMDNPSQEDIDEVVLNALSADKVAFEKYAGKVGSLSRLTLSDKSAIEKAMKELDNKPLANVKRNLFTGKYSVPDIADSVFDTAQKRDSNRAPAKKEQTELKYSPELRRMVKKAFDKARRELNAK
jgi:hypothetical protein